MRRNHLWERPIVHRNAGPAPAVLLSHPPAGRSAFRTYGDAMAYLAERLDVAGTILVTAHWLDTGDSPNLRLRVAHAPGEAASAEADRIADSASGLLAKAGLTCDLGGGVLQEAACQRTAAVVAAGSTRPVIHLSVPVNFGADLMILTGAALAPTRRSGVLLAGCGDEVDDQVLAAATDPVALKVYARRAPRQRIVHLYPWIAMLASATAAERSGEVQKLPGTRIAVLGLHRDTFDMLPARTGMITEGVTT